jgi:hypothetical protein
MQFFHYVTFLIPIHGFTGIFNAASVLLEAEGDSIQLLRVT